MGSFSETRIDPFISWLGLLPIRVLSPQTGQVKRGGGGISYDCLYGEALKGVPFSAFRYRKIPKISPSKYKPPKPLTQKTLR